MQDVKKGQPFITYYFVCQWRDQPFCSPRGIFAHHTRLPTLSDGDKYSKRDTRNYIGGYADIF